MFTSSVQGHGWKGIQIGFGFGFGFGFGLGFGFGFGLGFGFGFGFGFGLGFGLGLGVPPIAGLIIHVVSGSSYTCQSKLVLGLGFELG